MAGKSREESLKELNAQKMELTLDEYYEKHVIDKPTTSDSSSQAQKYLCSCGGEIDVLQLTLDGYYKQVVLPKQRAEQQKKLYQRTHYFGANYLKQRQEAAVRINPYPRRSAQPTKSQTVTEKRDTCQEG